MPSYGGNSRAGDPPRVIFVSSETHRSSIPIDFDAFGEPVDYGVADGVKYYGLSKLAPHDVLPGALIGA